MSVKILYLEDDANMIEHTKERLLAENFDVEEFDRIDLAKEYFSEHKEDIDCIITDLNMNDEWLEEHQVETDGGMLSGWVWLQQFVFKEKPDIPTIIYSGYISYLKEYTRENNNSHLLEKKNIKCVEKNSGENAKFKGLLKAINSLIKAEEI